MTGGEGAGKEIGTGNTADLTQTSSAAGSTGAVSGNTGDTGSVPTSVSTGEIEVYVVGCVNSPGIVMLKKGDVIYDAVEKAGGLSGDADASSINMVYKLNENTMLYIKSKKEIDSGKTPLNPSKNTALTAKTESPVKTASPGIGAELIAGSGSSAEMSTGESGDNTGSDVLGGNGKGTGTVNINTADIAALDKLPGVGEATAREIIAYRDRNGPYRKIEDIMKVPRIKQGRFDSIKDLISVN